MFGFNTKNTKPNEEEAKKQPPAESVPPSNTPKESPPKPIEPEALGTGMAARAGKALKDRRAQLDEAASYANGGPVRGPGTGTSDDIQTEVPQGSYIMPADSTAQIGEDALGGLGFNPKVPVNLSNGEYQLPPEQVHAVGVQALNQMKDATHQEVPDGNDEGQGFNPKVYFANGGVVDEAKKSLRAGSNVVAPGSGYLNTDMAVGAGKAALGAVASPFAAVIDAGYDLRNRALDADPSTSAGGNAKFLTAALETAKQGGAQFGQGVEQAKSDIRSDLGLAKAQPQTAPATPATAAAKPSTVQPATTATTGTNSPPPLLAQPQSQTPTAAAPGATSTPTAGTDTSNLPNNVTRVGNSFSGQNISEGFTVNGQRPALGDGVRSAQNQKAVDALFSRTKDLASVPDAAPVPTAGTGFGFDPRGGGGGGMTLIRDTSASDRERQRLISAASTPHAGAQNGQLTANQLNTLRAVQEGDQRTDLTRSTTDANNATRLTEAAMNTASANQRAAMQEQGANTRAAANNQLEQQKFNADSEARGFQVRAMQRQEKLYEQYDKAKPEERAAIAQQIQQLTGKQAPNKFTVVPGGQEIGENGMLITRPAQVFDNQTGQFVQQQSGTGQRAPQIGEQRGGYRFKGGNPADQSNWEKI